MNRDRRVVVSIAVGLALAAVARALVHQVTGVDGGWFAYQTEGSGPFFASSGSDTLVTALIWLMAIIGWLAVSWRLFGDRPDGD